MSTITLPALPEVHIPRVLRMQQTLRWGWLTDTWLICTFIVATITSVAAWLYAYQNHLILLYGDAHSHIDIARRLIDNASPGLAQLGGVWLPLPHLVMEPFIWNDFLWRTGLAGSFSSMPCYVASAMFIFLAARRLTNDSRASFIGTLLFIFNPNILYLQTTPLSEMVCIATSSAACYFFLEWAQEDKLSHLVRAAAVIFLATLARYDGWALYIACLCMIAVIGIRKGHSRKKIQGNVLLFGSLGGFGIALWFLWNAMIFNDPLYFQHSQYSAQAQQQVFIGAHLDETYHNLWMAIHDYGVLANTTVGTTLMVTGAVAFVIFLLRNRLSPGTLAASIYCVPFLFYVVSLFGGQAILFAPGAAPHGIPDPYFNTRYGVGIITPIAVYVATLVMRWPLGQIALLVAIIGQSIWISQTGVIAVQDGQFGISCFPYSVIPVYLARHYDGGKVLDDTYNTRQDVASAGIQLQNVVYQGSGKLWTEALHSPASVVDWIIVVNGDLVFQHIDITSKGFLSKFTPVIQDPSSRVWLFHRNGLAPLPTRSILPDLANNHFQLCGSIGRNDALRSTPIDRDTIATRSVTLVKEQ